MCVCESGIDYSCVGHGERNGGSKFAVERTNPQLKLIGRPSKLNGKSFPCLPWKSHPNSAGEQTTFKQTKNKAAMPGLANRFAST